MSGPCVLIATAFWKKNSIKLRYIYPRYGRTSRNSYIAVVGDWTPGNIERSCLTCHHTEHKRRRMTKIKMIDMKRRKHKNDRIIMAKNKMTKQEI